MTTGIAGLKSGNSIVPYSQTTKRTKKYSPTITGSGWTTDTTMTWYVAWADSDNNWFCTFYIKGTVTGGGSNNLYAITGLDWTAKNGSDQDFCANRDTDLRITPVTFRAANNASTAIFIFSTATQNDTYNVEGTIALESEPTWAAANMEASTDASIYIEPASDTNSGLLSYYKTETVDISSSGNFSAGNGNLVCERINNTVTITSDAVLSHTNGSSANSASGLIPEDFRPSDTVINIYGLNSTRVTRATIASDGTFGVEYQDWAGGAFSNTTTTWTVSISYVIT